jgi:Nitric oxide reductase activation protein
MDASQALRDTLESMTKVYHEETVPIEFGAAPRVVPKDGDLRGETMTEPTVVVNPAPGDKFNDSLSGPEELRCITNTLSHELEHIRESELTSKATFRERYPTHPDFAGGIINILEDQYIDYTRTQRFPGLKTTEAFVIEKLYRDDDIWPPINSIETTARAMLEGVRQVAFCGYAKGITDCEDWIREFLSRVRPQIKEVRREDSQPRRAERAHTVMAIAEEYLPDEDIQLPDTCAVCDELPPTIIAPIRGPVCDECVSEDHSPQEQSPDAEGTDAETGVDDQAASAGDVEPSAGGEDTAADGPEPSPGDPKNSAGGQNPPTGDSGNTAGDADSTDGPPVVGADRMVMIDTPTVDGGRSTWYPSAPDLSLIEPPGAQPDGESGHPESTAQGEASAELSTMETLARNENVASWWDVPDDIDHRSVSSKDISRCERIKQANEVEDDLLTKLRKRRLAAKETDYAHSEDYYLHSTNLSKSDAWRKLREDFRRTFRKITTRDMPVPSRVGNELNMDNVVQRAAGDTSRDKLYDRSQTIARGGRIVAVSADMSTSMTEKQVKLALAAIAEAASMVGDDFLATCWTEIKSSYGGYEVKRKSTGIGVVCDHDEPFEWTQLNAFNVGGGTPTADGVDITSQLVEDAQAREKLLIVITDGAPNSVYGGVTSSLTGSPVGDARKVVQRVRSKNIKVIGLFVGESAEDTAMAKIFGDDGYVEASMDDLAQELLGVYRDQLRV